MGCLNILGRLRQLQLLIVYLPESVHLTVAMEVATGDLVHCFLLVNLTIFKGLSSLICLIMTVCIHAVRYKVQWAEKQVHCTSAPKNLVRFKSHA